MFPWAILDRELRVAARRPATYMTRGIYLALLFFFFLFARLRAEGVGGLFDPDALPRMGREVFTTFAWAQFAVLALLGSFLAARGLAEEWERGTLPLLLSSGLADREIVFSKFLGAIFNLGFYLLSGLPFLFACSSFGGIAPENVLLVGLMTFSAILLAAALGLFAAAFDPAGAAAMSFALFFVYFGVIPGAAAVLARNVGPAAGGPEAAGAGFAWLHPAVLLGRLGPEPLLIPGLLCVGVTIVLARLFLRGAAVLLREQAALAGSRAGGGAIGRLGERILSGSREGAAGRRSAAARAGALLPSGLTFVMLLLLAGGILQTRESGLDPLLLSGFAALFLLSVGSAAAQAFAGEREQGTLPLLLLTSWTAGDHLARPRRRILRAVAVPFLAACGYVLLSAARGSAPPRALWLPLVLAAAALAILEMGLFFSLFLPTTTRATGWFLGAVGFLFAGPLLFAAFTEVSLATLHRQAFLSPFYWTAYLTGGLRPALSASRGEFTGEHALGLGAAVLFLALLALALRFASTRGFNALVGRPS